MTQEPGSWPPGSAAGQPAAERPVGMPNGPVSPWARDGGAPPGQPGSQDAATSPSPSAAATFAPAPVRDGGHPVSAPSASWSVAPTPTEGRWRPGHVEAVPGTGFGVVHLQVAPLTSGLAVGALMAGIAAVLVSLLVICFGVAGAEDGWGPWVAGAFTLLGGLAGGAGIGAGMAAMRQIRRSGRPGLIRFTGRGVAIGGVVCGAAGLAICLLALGLSLVVQVN